MADLATTIRNERTKLLAAAFDRASTTCFTVGIATPVAGYFYNIASLQDQLTTSRLAFGLIGWLLTAIALHFMARRALKGLQE